MERTVERPRRSAGGHAAGPPQRLRESIRRFLEAVAAFAYLWTCRRVGARARTLGRPLVRNAGRIEIGADVLIESWPARVELAAEGQGRLIIGHGVRIGPGSRVTASRYVEIGDRVSLGANCVVSDEVARSASDEVARIWIGDAVTIGDDVTVAPGTVIGAGAVIAARCTVSGAVPPYAILGGAVTAAGGAAEVARLRVPGLPPTPPSPGSAVAAASRSGG